MDIVKQPEAEILARADEAFRRLREQLAYVRTPEFQAEARRQAALLRGTPENLEAQAFFEAVCDLGGE